MTCETCGHQIAIGQWPWCPHGYPSAGISVISDELPNGPYWCETLGHEPVWVTSKSHLRREAEARGLECVGGRKSDDYFTKRRRWHDEELRDIGRNVEY